MLPDIGVARNVRRDKHPLVIPQPPIRLMLELACIDVETDAAQFALLESYEQRLLIDDFAASNVDQDGSRPHGVECLASDQVGRLRRPLATDRYAIALRQQRMQAVRAFQSGKARWQSVSRTYVAPGADNAHTNGGAQLANLPADTTRADDTKRFAFKDGRTVITVMEAMLLAIVARLVEPTREVVKTRQYVLGDRARVTVAARGCDDHVTAP